ncbi:hypothetical protein [Corynebacterium sp.]|uniref:hypothetical protein n=1 Tax=Corynebacterium sp. TaxID=1720 RepID=UPI0028AFFDAA|nr:hypothetical protein [Corynebacterium sp.]
MSNIDSVRHRVDVILRGCIDSDKALDVLEANDLLAPEPQIIRTPAELEALDPDAAFLDSAGEISLGSDYHDGGYDEKDWYHSDLPAVVVASGEHVRACRKALEGGEG